MLGHVQAINPGPLDDGAMKRLFERIIDEARRLERTGSGTRRESDRAGDGAAMTRETMDDLTDRANGAA